MERNLLFSVLLSPVKVDGLDFQMYFTTFIFGGSCGFVGRFCGVVLLLGIFWVFGLFGFFL